MVCRDQLYFGAHKVWSFWGLPIEFKCNRVSDPEGAPELQYSLYIWEMGPGELQLPKNLPVSKSRAGNCFLVPRPRFAWIILTAVRTCALETGKWCPPSSSALKGTPTTRSPEDHIREEEGTSLLGKALPDKAVLAHSFAPRNVPALLHPPWVQIKTSVIIRYLKENQMRLRFKSI